MVVTKDVTIVWCFMLIYEVFQSTGCLIGSRIRKNLRGKNTTQESLVAIHCQSKRKPVEYMSN